MTNHNTVRTDDETYALLEQAQEAALGEPSIASLVGEAVEATYGGDTGDDE